MEKIELQSLVGGALQEEFEKSFEKVVKNLQDLNTSYRDKRSITIKMTFEQNEARDDVKTSITVAEKLAPQQGLNTAFYIGRDLETGKVVAQEYGKQVKGQMNLDDYSSQQIIDGKTVDTDTGEVIGDDSVVDFRKAAK